MRWLPALTWRQPGGLPECPYFKLSQIAWPSLALAAHEWEGDDDHRAMHDHGQWFVTLVVRGGYRDVSYDHKTGRVVTDILRPGSLRFRPATFTHQVLDVQPGTVTLLLKGRKRRRWGFWKDGKLIKRDRYFVTDGHHGCTPEAPAIRLRPDGSRVAAQGANA